jgi:methylated-DNA-[protein]-cysteine S-methyltransferase
MQAWSLVASPVGHLRLTTDGAALTGMTFESRGGGSASCGGDDEHPGCRDDEHSVLVRAAGQLAEYFARQRREFDLLLAPSGTAFQLRVWAALQGIPFGVTTSYGRIARDLGLPPGASRAVGLANGANPIPIVIPCHRVVGADGSLTGYGGGLDRKRILLDLESDALF